MQIVFDFIAGDIPFDEFWEAYCADPKIGEWLDSIADFSHEPPQVIAKDHWLRTLYRAIASVYDGHMLKMLEKSPYPPKDAFTTGGLDANTEKMMQARTMIAPSRHTEA